MLTTYWIAFVVGGVFVLLAVLSGLDGVDVGDHDFDGHLDDDVELSEPKERSPNVFSSRQRHPWYSIFSILKSLKFWTFGLCFFGLTGLVLSNLGVNLPARLVAIAAILMGLICGSLVAGSLRLLRRRQVDSLVRSDDLVGMLGTVEIPFDHSSRGKIRVLVKGSLIDLIANTDDRKALQTGDRVLVVGTEQNRVWVVRSDNDDLKNTE
jgi:hypothetical protein